METIRIDVGVYTVIKIDCSNFDFTGIEKLVFTVKNKPVIRCPALIEREFMKPGKYNIVISPEESLLLKNGAEYDFNKVTINGERYKVTENGEILLRKGVGDAIE